MDSQLTSGDTEMMYMLRKRTILVKQTLVKTEGENMISNDNMVNF
jgi:hypothetical protein